ncbi:zinc finger bed domain-containing protein 1-like [Gigaspora margarita]|uniref:Zinc finger bed domain-containing protein 1-like n=1 Tax=Gigaspora margarita TaxID=4874 RepID=A0A8H4AGY2_GIGMA|nr:zinc finger bed domain-containing protein 1-like [Gigaspora margarita]
MTNNEYTEYTTNNEYTERATNNNNGISNDLVSETGSSIQTELSSNSGQSYADIWEEFNSINNGARKHKEASCRYCPLKWSRERVYEMKSYLAIKCKSKVPKEI